MKKDIQKFIDEGLSEEKEKLLIDKMQENEDLSEEVFSQLQMDESLSSFFKDDHDIAVNNVMAELDQVHAVDHVMVGVKEFERKKNRRRFIFSLAACAALLLCSFLIPYFLSDQVPKSSPENVVSAKFINVPLGKAVQQTLANGVQLSIKGPAEYLIDNQMLVKLNRGLLIANVSKSASGFTVSTPDGLVRDISTQFSVRVLSGKTEVSVIKGEVEVRLHHETQFTRVKELNKISLFPKTISIAEDSEESGNIISINFGGYGEVREKTGAVLAGNWNNVGAPLNFMPLEDNTGGALWTTVKVSDKTVWKADYVKENSPNSNLFLGRLMGGQVKGQNADLKPLEISLKDIPFKKYDVYVYYWQGRSNDTHAFVLQANDGPKFNIERHNAKSIVTDASFSRWLGEGENKSGNYFVFEGLEGATVLIRASSPERTDVHRQWHISGMQIISRD